MQRKQAEGSFSTLHESKDCSGTDQRFPADAPTGFSTLCESMLSKLPEAPCTRLQLMVTLGFRKLACKEYSASRTIDQDAVTMVHLSRVVCFRTLCEANDRSGDQMLRLCDHPSRVSVLSASRTIDQGIRHALVSTAVTVSVLSASRTIDQALSLPVTSIAPLSFSTLCESNDRSGYISN